jgi:hypothetical protein
MAWTGQSGTKFGGLLGPPMQFGVAHWAPDWARGSALFLFLSIGKSCSIDLLALTLVLG